MTSPERAAGVLAVQSSAINEACISAQAPLLPQSTLNGTTDVMNYYACIGIQTTAVHVLVVEAVKE